MQSDKSIPQATLFQALIPIIVLILLLTFNVIFYGDMATSGANQLALILAATAAALVGFSLKVSFSKMLKGIVDSITASMSAILILLLIGALAGTWLISGIVPTMIYYGLQVLNPTIFLFAAVIVCSIVSVATGSSWSTVATVGIALLGIGKALNIGEGWVAGAIISGAYFGDKISPMSDTTNLAPAMAGTDLFTHIRYMMITTVPSMILTLLIFLGVGLFTDHDATVNSTAALSDAVKEKFYISPILFIAPAIVIWMIVKKVNALPALLAGVLLGALFAVIFQPQIIAEVAGATGSYVKQSYMAIMNAMGGAVSVASDNDIAAGLLSSRGMAGMLNTIWLILCALAFGGVMESVGLLKRITSPLVKKAKSNGSLVATTAGSCVFINVTASDQYLSIVVPGKMFAQTYKERGLAPQNLSRTLEDAGTVTSVLVPWNTCGATQTAVLGVSTFVYAPFCFFNIISPFMTILVAYLGFKVAKLPPSKMGDVHPAQVSDDPSEKPVEYMQ